MIKKCFNYCVKILFTLIALYWSSMSLYSFYRYARCDALIAPGNRQALVSYDSINGALKTSDIAAALNDMPHQKIFFLSNDLYESVRMKMDVSQHEIISLNDKVPPEYKTNMWASNYIIDFNELTHPLAEYEKNGYVEVELLNKHYRLFRKNI